MSTPPLSTTSYAVLSLLGVQSWTAYELAQQMDRSLGRLWPRAVSKVYEEPKKLVAHGLATATAEAAGGRTRMRYAITESGRRALAAWHADPGRGPVLEFEQLLKLLFAEHGTREDALASLRAARSWAVERNVENAATARAHAAGSGPFPDRLPQTLLAGRFLTDFYRLVAEWADWAGGVVAQWPEDPSQAVAPPEEVADVVRRATWD